MAQRRAIDLALDLARMPALARTSVAPPIPPNVIELMRIAAASPKDCEDAVAATGEPAPVLVEASRFYLQQSLFRPDADSYRTLGLEPGASRATARNHMRWLLEWLHPDRNNDLDAVYAERVLKAWREISGFSPSAAIGVLQATTRKPNGQAPVRLPWIKLPATGPHLGRGRAFRVWMLPAGIVIVFLVAWSAVYYFGTDQTAAMIGVR